MTIQTKFNFEDKVWVILDFQVKNVTITRIETTIYQTIDGFNQIIVYGFPGSEVKIHEAFVFESKEQLLKSL